MRTRTYLFPMMATLLLLIGCGSGSHLVTDRSASGRATFMVLWPKPDRLIPAAANSIVVQIVKTSGVIATQTLARPASGGTATVAFNVLPTGTFTATATAYPNTDGTGVAQAAASTSLTIQANQNTAFSLTMASTIDHLAISPTNLTLNISQSSSLMVTAYDSQGNMVLLSPSKLQWASSNPGTVAVDQTGKVTGVSVGSTQITATDTESGKSASATVTTADVYIIKGIPYQPSTPQETLTATFTVPDGGITVNSYQGYVLLTVSGVGQSYGTVYNDAFYLYTPPFTTPQNGNDGGYYMLAYGTSTLMIFDAGNDVTNFLVNPLPAYNPAHTYTFILNTTLSSPGHLHFGVSDGGFSDNTGAYTISVTQLVPTP